MIVEQLVVTSPLSRSRLWGDLVRLETLGDWSAVSQCVSTTSDSFESAQSYVCVLQHGDDRLDATVVVTRFEPPESLHLRTSSPMAVVSEQLVVEPDGRGARLRYSASATSSMFGPAVTVWLHDHVRLVHDKLQVFADPRGGNWPQARPST